jgi:hypothetical protein
VVFPHLPLVPWFPCVATYAERGNSDVVVSISQVKCTPTLPRRKLQRECSVLSNEQVEAWCHELYQQLAMQPAPAVETRLERRISFVREEEEEEEHEVEKEKDEEEDELEEDVTAAAPEATDAKIFHLLNNPALCLIDDKSSLGLPASHGEVQHDETAPVRPLPVKLSLMEQYTSLLWELLARESRKCLDVVVLGKNGGGKLEVHKEELVEVVSSLFHNKDGHIPIMHVDQTMLFQWTSKHLIALGNQLTMVKRKLKRPTTSFKE